MTELFSWGFRPEFKKFRVERTTDYYRYSLNITTRIIPEPTKNAFVKISAMMTWTEARRTSAEAWMAWAPNLREPFIT